MKHLALILSLLCAMPHRTMALAVGLCSTDPAQIRLQKTKSSFYSLSKGTKREDEGKTPREAGRQKSHPPSRAHLQLWDW